MLQHFFGTPSSASSLGRPFFPVLKAYLHQLHLAPALRTKAQGRLFFHVALRAEKKGKVCFTPSTAIPPTLQKHYVEPACRNPKLILECACRPALSGMLPTVFTSPEPVCAAASRYRFHNYPLNPATVASYYPSPEKCKWLSGYKICLSELKRLRNWSWEPDGAVWKRPKLNIKENCLTESESCTCCTPYTPLQLTIAVN